MFAQHLEFLAGMFYQAPVTFSDRSELTMPLSAVKGSTTRAPRLNYVLSHNCTKLKNIARFHISAKMFPFKSPSKFLQVMLDNRDGFTEYFFNVRNCTISGCWYIVDASATSLVGGCREKHASRLQKLLQRVLFLAITSCNQPHYHSPGWQVKGTRK